MDPDRIYKYKIQELIYKLNYYTKKYDEGNPEISDKEWDDMYFELQDLENWTGLHYEDSPTQKINYQVVNKLNKVEHNHPMLSLNKTKEVSEIEKFVKDKDYICMAKMDGLTCSLKYINGKLVSAETRGNGQIGEDILHNALVVKNIPNKIKFKEELIIDGEIICTYEDFKPFEKDYKNPRNFASGSIRLLDSHECSKRKLSFIAWDCIKGLENEQDTLVGKLEVLNNLGFTITPMYFGTNNIDMAIEQIKLKANALNYPIDGAVFKFNQCDEYEAAGRTDHHFKGGLAYKFYDEEYETTIEDIEWTMGRTGVLTPVAILAPIEIDGTEVSRASLHNISVMLETVGHAYKGQKVWIYKANMIIPQIAKAEKKDLTISEFRCEFCPICGEHTELKNNNGVLTLYCSNPQCEGKLVNRIEHFFGKKGLDAKGISKATISKLIDIGWVTRISDMFDLSRYKNEWEVLPGFGEKSVSNILKSIDACRNCSLESAISAIGIPLIGRTVAKDLAERFTTYATFKENIEGNFDFFTIDGYGYEMNKSLKTFDYSELDYIVENYLNIQEENVNYFQTIPNSVSLKGLQYCITGKLNIWKNREELTKTIESLGGKVTGTVSKNTTHLINNDISSTSAKNKKAHELGIPIITEQMFADIIDFQK